MDEVDPQRITAGDVDERLRQSPRQQTAPGGVHPLAQGRAGQEYPEPGEQGEIIEGRERRAGDPEREQPIKADHDALHQGSKHHPQADDDRAPRGACRRPGLIKGRTVDQDRDRQTLEDAEIDGGRRVEDIGDGRDGEGYGEKLQAPADVVPAQRGADPRQDDEEPGEEIMGYRPGLGGQVSRKTEEPPDAAEFAEVEEEVVTHHEDDGQAAQEIDLPDPRRAGLPFHAVRIYRTAVLRQRGRQTTPF